MRPFLYGLCTVLVCGGGGYALWGGEDVTKSTSVSTSAVERRDIVSRVKANGKVTFAREQTLNFNLMGTVTKVNVKEGDQVKQGQILAELDASSVLADVRSAQLSVGASTLQLQQLEAEREASLLKAKQAVEEARRQYDQAQRSLEVSQDRLPAQLEDARRTVSDREASLAQAQLDLQKQEASELQELAQTASETLATAESLLDTFYGVLTNSTVARPSRDDFELEIYMLLSNDDAAEHQARTAYLNSVRLASTMHDRYGNTLSTERDPSAVRRALDDARELASSIYALGESTYQLLQDATTDTTTFTVQALESLRSSAVSGRNQANQLLDTIDAATVNLLALDEKDASGVPSVTLQAKRNSVEAAARALAQAESDLDLLTRQNPADLQELADTIARLEGDVAAQEANLTTSTTSTDLSIQLKRNDIAQRATSVQKAQKTLQDYRLTAPFDGTVTHVDYKVGDNLLDTGDDSEIVLQNHDFLLVTIPLDQMDVVRVQTGMTASLTFDAVPGQTFTGTIDSIDSTPVSTSGVVSYNVEVKLPTPPNLTILSGMSATVTIETARREGVLTVPNLALTTQAGGVSVQTASGDTLTVTLGASDGRYTEVLTGVSEGQLVITKAVSAQTTSTNATQQLFRLGGGGGGPPR
jgi:RND family efflux transporter MFP subunit